MSKSQHKYTVLFVDDEPRITVALRAIFRRNYNVLTANSGAEALNVLGRHQVNVVVSDQRMPEMLGNELLAEVAKAYPQTMRVLLTGFMDRAAIVDSINEGEVYRFISKPWRNDEMQVVVEEASIASEMPVLDQEALPVPSASTSSDETSMPVAHKERALLMVEKQQDIRNQIRRFCSDEEIMIYGTQNVEQAVAAATSREAIGVVVIELSDDPNAALQTINLLKQARPELVTIVLTDELDSQTAVDLINQGQVYKYLAKPLNMSGFQAAIERAFLLHRNLRSNKQVQTRYKVERHKGRIVEGLQSWFSRLGNVPA